MSLAGVGALLAHSATLVTVALVVALVCAAVCTLGAAARRRRLRPVRVVVPRDQRHRGPATGPDASPLGRIGG